MEKAGLSNRVQESVEKAGLKVDVYNKISFEPTMDSVQNAVKAGRETGSYDVVIGIGGGSVMDTSKMVANMLTNPGDPRT